MEPQFELVNRGNLYELYHFTDPNGEFAYEYKYYPEDRGVLIFFTNLRDNCPDDDLSLAPYSLVRYWDKWLTKEKILANLKNMREDVPEGELP